MSSRTVSRKLADLFGEPSLELPDTRKPFRTARNDSASSGEPCAASRDTTSALPDPLQAFLAEAHLHQPEAFCAETIPEAPAAIEFHHRERVSTVIAEIMMQMWSDTDGADEEGEEIQPSSSRSTS